MNDLKRFLIGIPVGLWVVVLFFIVIVCVLPAILTLPGFLDFSRTGEIGDTIGGIMGPFIAILAAILTFIAFWTQFDANRELVRENHRNHFENRFYKMLDIHLNNVAELNGRMEDNDTDSVFHKWCLEIENLFRILKLQSDFGGFIDDVKYKSRKNDGQEEFVTFLTQMQNSHDTFVKIVFETTYCLFFTGGTSTLKYGDNKQTSKVRQYASLLTTYLVVNGIDELKILPKNELLGRYYRHLFQIVKYVDGQPDDMFDEKEWKKEYLGILRSQMSDFEQLLLYYNAQSSLGKAWDENHYIERYQLIKNIPYSSIAFCAGVPPCDRYAKEVKAVEDNGGIFFENG